MTPDNWLRSGATPVTVPGTVEEARTMVNQLVADAAAQVTVHGG